MSSDEIGTTIENEIGNDVDLFVAFLHSLLWVLEESSNFFIVSSHEQDPNGWSVMETIESRGWRNRLTHEILPLAPLLPYAISDYVHATNTRVNTFIREFAYKV